MLTEQHNPNTQNIDQLETLALVQTIHAEDRTVIDAVARVLPEIAQAIDAITACMQRGGRLLYSGAGTSGRLGILDASECPPTFGTPPEWVQGIIAGGERAMFSAIEGVEDDASAGATDLQARNLTEDDAVVGIAASGRTPYVLGALAYAKQIGAVTIGISNNAPSALLEAADIPIAVITGAEVIAGSTRMKAGTAQKLVLNMLSTGTMIKLGKVYGNLMVDVQVKNEKLLQRARRIVAQVGKVDDAQAAVLLDAAGNDVKTAVVMARRGVNADQAHTYLKAAGGFLRRVIDE
jgi:N-acetylmuramic acid 6-phosphate etherase